MDPYLSLWHCGWSWWWRCGYLRCCQRCGHVMTGDSVTLITVNIGTSALQYLRARHSVSLRIHNTPCTLPRSLARHGDIPNVQQNYSIREWNIFGRFKIFFRCTELYSTGTKPFYVWQYNFLNAIVHRSFIHPVKEWRSQLHTSLHLQYDISRSLSVSGGRARGGHLSPLAHGLGFSPSVIITSDTVRTQKIQRHEWQHCRRMQQRCGIVHLLWYLPQMIYRRLHFLHCGNNVRTFHFE